MLHVVIHAALEIVIVLVEFYDGKLHPSLRILSICKNKALIALIRIIRGRELVKFNILV